MNSQAIINSAVGVGTALTLAKFLPPLLGYRLAGKIASTMANRTGSPLNLALRTNQWIMSGKTLGCEELDIRIREVLNSTARCLFDFYHYLPKPDIIQSKVEIPSTINQYFSDKQSKNAVFVTTHLSNFDLVGQALGLAGYRFQILSYPSPGSGYSWQNKIRKDSGHIITPTSFQSLHQARVRLENGENILTGLDRPIASGKYKPVFFGHPATLPVTYTRLALQTMTPVVVVSAITKPDGDYTLYISDPVQMKSMSDPESEALRNTEAVLEVAEELISKNARQWSMFYPIWPEQMNLVP
jgi:lauroyl/myristoyl acyltransferase